MKSKYFPLLLVTFIVIGIFGGISSFSLLSPDTEYVEQKPYDAGPEFRSRKISEYPTTTSLSTTPQSSDEAYYLVGDTLEWYVSDDNAEGGIFADAFQLMAVGELSEVWVQVNMSYPDSRDTPVVTIEDAEWFLTEFESNIYPKDTEYFGTPDFHNGSDAILGDLYLEPNGRNVILISNIRDEGYYDMQYPYYTVGFYWGVFEDAFGRNIVSIDSADFANRRETVYAPTLAHEYQHLMLN